MRVRGVWFPIFLAVLWVVMSAFTVVEFAAFNAATRPAPLVGKILLCNDAGVTC